MVDAATRGPSWARAMIWFIAPSFVLIALALQCNLGAAFVWHEGTIEETGNWTGDDWAGERYTMEYSPDGSLLMLVGYGGPNEVRILDRDMDLVGIWEPTGPDLMVEGASWSTSSERVSVWGANGAEGNDSLLMLTVPGLEPTGEFNRTTNNTLVDITLVRLLAGDAIIAIGGRDGTGASRLQVFEVETLHLISDIGWKENATIVAIEYDGVDMLVLDDRGFLSTIETTSWTLGTRWEGAGGPPSAECLGEFVDDRICIVGYENGRVRVWEGYPRDLQAEADTGEGPVMGIASLFQHPRFYAIAVPRAEGGARISGWIHNASWGEKEWSNIIETSAGVLSMGADPQVAGQFLTAFDDGTIASYWTSIILDLPPAINITDPPMDAKWVGVMTLKGEVIDEIGRVEWVRYSINGGEWMEANGTSEFTIEIDTEALEPATHSITIKVFDGVHEHEILYDFFIPQPSDDDDMKYFWYWFTGCTSLVVVALLALYYLLIMIRRASQPPPEEERGLDEGAEEEGTQMSDLEKGPER